MVLKLYKMDISPPARAAMMVTELIKVPVQMVDVNLMKGEHLEPTFLKKNPVHCVPVLEDGDFILSDSHAIVTYLLETYGSDDSLYPKDPKRRAVINQLLHFDTGVLFQRLRNVTYFVFLEGLKKASERQLSDIDEAYGFTEQFLTRNKWLAGDHMTVADICAVATITGLNHLLPLDGKKYPKIKAWCSEMEKKPFYQKQSAPGNALYAKALKELMS